MKTPLFVLALASILLTPSVSSAAELTNALQDCWTTSISIQREQYSFTPDDVNIIFTWQHRIGEFCSNYAARIVGVECSDGLTRPDNVAFSRQIQVGPVEPDPTSLIQTFSVAFGPTEIPPGDFDWFVMAECNDSGNGISLQPDGDVDEACGVNFGLDPVGPVVFGPQPIHALDPDAGGSPDGRRPGEDGTTRPWCFTVSE